MSVSIITPSYNSDENIASCLKSVKDQNICCEHIIIDGASTDTTIEIIKKNVTKFISEKDNGIYDALNKGIKLASGDIIGLLHSDDVFYDENILSLISKEFEDQNIECVYGDLLYVSSEDENKIIRYWKACDFSPQLLNKGWMPPHPTLFIRKSIIEKYGLYSLDYKIAADYDFILRYFGTYKIKSRYIPKVLVKMRVGGESNKSIKNIIRKSWEDYKALKSNNMPYPLYTLFMKNISKISQFWSKQNSNP